MRPAGDREAGDPGRRPREVRSPSRASGLLRRPAAGGTPRNLQEPWAHPGQWKGQWSMVWRVRGPKAGGRKGRPYISFDPPSHCRGGACPRPTPSQAPQARAPDPGDFQNNDREWAGECLRPACGGDSFAGRAGAPAPRKRSCGARPPGARLFRWEGKRKLARRTSPTSDQKRPRFDGSRGSSADASIGRYARRGDDRDRSLTHGGSSAGWAKAWPSSCGPDPSPASTGVETGRAPRTQSRPARAAEGGRA